ncbi:DeoR/GlpR transcriptional regulator [Paenibacillus sp. HN-1]|uniref:DeoR/GlpR family DNA-binding transcription regulator n=1 Tax=Paenibacillus TaxID=44249 RepID=UPI001CA7CAEE|nr:MULTISPECIES: DeoR/GlpR family DNA-binding transcription regulator [Paenibacillus]MBY9077351.1 DeoR/GlpR transcriptional regulator [Paenibacillus sp. CGMCC 1.18879]MBY9084663.1 DeoR/GlpR transcriptional regulator [Paenibacillus sinensis]
MKAFERRDKIVNELYRYKKVHVADLAQKFNVSEETIRRDLDKLDKEGIAKKNYGGAILNVHTNEDPSYTSRHQINLEAKANIASNVLDLINDGDSIMTDSSSTAFESLRKIIEVKQNLTIITNSLMVLSEFQHSGHKLISTGGTLGPQTGSFVGTTASYTIQKYNVDVALISCKALSMTKYISDSNEAESELKIQMQRQANKVILLADHTKFDRIAFVNLLSMDQVDYIVTDKKPPDEWIDFFQKNQVSLVFDSNEQYL